MRLLKLMVVLATVGAFWGCKSTSEVGTTSTLTYDAEGNVYLQPPEPGQGIQILIDTFPVPLNTEIQGDFFFKLPITSELKVGRIEIAMNKGSHHMNCFRRNTGSVPPDSVTIKRKMIFTQDGKSDTIIAPYQATFNTTATWNESDMMVEAQIDHLDWTLATMPSDTSVPATLRGKKTVVVLEPNQDMIVENHYVNATIQTTPNGKGKIYINLYKATEANTVQASMYVGRRSPLVLPPNQYTTVSKLCNFPANSTFPLYILGMTGHYHSLGKLFTVQVIQELYDSLGNRNGIDSTPVMTPYGQTIYSNPAWSEPPFTSYDPPVKLDVGQTLRYTATYFNSRADTVYFGPQVLTQEHDNLFAWFVPGLPGGSSVNDLGP